jgi:GntR family transcriptional regulator/MocR family aminotransferase
VVYAGSFSKTFSPALRLGYAIVPPFLRETWRAYRELMDIHSCVFTQAAMASMLETGALDRHVRRMRRLYSERRSALLRGIERIFGPLEEGGSGIEIMGEAAGLHLAIRFGVRRLRGNVFDEVTVSRIASQGAVVYPLRRYAFEPLADADRTLLFGYGNLSEEEIERGLAAIARALDPGNG